MTVVDILMVLALGGCAVFGFLRGFVQESLSLLAWVLAVFAVRLFLAPVTDIVGATLGMKTGMALVALLLLFGITFALGKWIARRLGTRMRSSLLGPIDRVLGAGFGMIKGLIGATLLFLAYMLLYNMIFGAKAERPDWLRHARSYPLLNASGEAISRFARSRSADLIGGPPLVPNDEAAISANATRAMGLDRP